MVFEIIRVIGAIAILVFICWLLSTNRSAVNWRAVLMGLGLQALIAVVVLWSQAGQRVLQTLSDGVTQVVNSATAGATFVFGEGWEEHFLVVTIPSTIIFFSLLMSMLYHLGIVQRIVGLMARGIRFVLPVSGAESLVACANVFIGNTESPLLVKPYIPRMTNSEIMAMMTAGMATMSGGMLAVYAGFGAEAGHLITASLMAAPGSIVVAKILVPETDTPATMAGHIEHAPSDAVNIFQAMTKGASDGLTLAANVIAMLIAFISLIALLNMILGVFPDVGGEPLSLQRILGWVFMPFAFLIGADWKDATAVGNLLGIKLFLTEFLAYTELKSLGDTISDKSRAVATFALCGFSSFISIGIQVGGIGALVPERKNDIASVALTSMIGGSIVTLITATIASLFF